MSEWMACNFWSRQPLAPVEEQSLQTYYSVVQALASDVAFTVPKLKIRRGVVVDDIPPLLPASSAPFVGISIPLASETMVSSSSFIPLAPEVTSGVPSVPFLVGPVSLSKNFRRSDKRKTATDSKEETSIPRKGIEDAGDSRRTGRGWKDPSSKVEDRVSQDREASRTPIPSPTGKYGYINIGSCRDELDPTILGKLPTPVAIAAVSVHKYWTSAYGKAADNA
ncbi:hypothetical protein Fot_06182 [Forsythia ovata]|uniref:Uncharacterized protein n=1 Tax=Forsythia ovata TaxID=205694 RepID=A0ABD1WV61_9LAMI